MYNTSIYDRQHDVETIDSDGHLEYIYSLYKTNHLPTNNFWQHYQPPLFHITGAFWLQFTKFLNLSLNKRLEGLQVLTVIFSFLIMLIVYAITNKLKISNKSKLIINIFLAFHPTFIILSSSINNDCLLTLFQILIVYYLIKWYENDNWLNTIILALITGLSVMTKFNGAIMAIPILYIFIKKFISIIKTNKKEIPKYIAKILVFAIISLPIGLWFEIRQLILFGSNSIPEPGDFVYTGNHSLFERFIKIDIINIFKNIFCEIPGDYNVFSYIVKSSIFGEFDFNKNIITYLLLIFNLILIFIATYFIIKYVIKRKDKNFILNIFLILYLVNMFSYYIFNITYPYCCTMDFRYIVPTLFSSIMITCWGLENINKHLATIINTTIFIFSILSIIFIYQI